MAVAIGRPVPTSASRPSHTLGSSKFESPLWSTGAAKTAPRQRLDGGRKSRLMHVAARPRGAASVHCGQHYPLRSETADARALSPTSPPRRSTVAVSQLCRGITTEPQRGARPAPPSHELVSRPPRRRKPTPCLKACSNDSRHCTRPRATLQPPLSSLLCRFAAVAAARRCHGRASDTPLRAVRLHILRLS